MDFLSWFKTPIKPGDVKQQQTDSPKAQQLHREFENHPSKGLSPSRLASILLAAEQGNMIAQAELFMDMEEKDAHIAAELSKRKMAVKKLAWSLEPPRDASAKERKNAKLLEDLIRDELDVGCIRMDMLDAIGHGYSCIELAWGQTAQGLWVPTQCQHRPPNWFTCPQDNRNILHLRESGAFYGVPLQPFGWIAHTHKTRSGYLARTGLHRVLAWPYLYKNYSVRDLAEFLEIYGLPIRIGTYNAGTTTDQQKADLLRSILSIGHHAAGIIPDNMRVELQQVMASGNSDGFTAMINWCEASQSKAILGGTLTSSTAANGNRSLGQVHNEVRLDIRDDDATQLDQTLSSHLVYPLAMLNGLFADNRCPKWISDIQEPDDLLLLADALPKLADAGVKIPLRYVNLKLKIPEPEDGEDIMQAKAQPQVAPNNSQPPSPQAATSLAYPPLQKEGGGIPDSDPTPVDAETDQLAAAAGPSIKNWVETIRTKVDNADSLETLRDDLINSYADLEADELTKVMALAFATADLSGRYDVNEGQ